MITRSAAGIAGLCLLAGLLFAADKDAKELPPDLADAKAVKQKSSPTETLVYSARGASATSLAVTLGEIFDDPSVQVVAEPLSNLLLVRVPEGRRDEVMMLLKQIDRMPSTITIQLYLLKAQGEGLSEGERDKLSGDATQVAANVRELTNSGRVYVSTHMELTAIENNKALLQIGQDAPVLSGANITPGRGQVNNYRYVSVGTLLTLQARVTDDRDVVMEMEFEQSDVADARLGEAAEGSATGSVTRLTHQTTVTLHDGTASLVGTVSTTDKVYLVASAQIRGATAERGPTVFRALSGSVRSGGRPGAAEGSASGSFGGPSSGFVRQVPSPEQLESLARATFARADRNEDGQLDESELRRLPPQTTEADADGDGRVTLNEHVAWFPEYLRTRGGPRPPGRSSRSESQQPEASQEQPETRRSESAAGTELDPRYKLYYEKLVEKYDEDGDGKLSEDEQASMTRPPEGADADEDGLLTVEELIRWHLRDRK